MKKSLAIVLVLVIVSLGLYSHVFATPSTQQTPSCPTYQVNLVIDLVDSTPVNAAPGDTVVTRFHVVYQDGTPATLSPETASFVWSGASGQKEFDNVPVIYTGNPGFYNYTQSVTADLAQATGSGKVTVSVLGCSCSDARGNRGPISNTGSEDTLTPSDNSNVQIGPGGTTTTGMQPLSYIVLAAIAILLLLALLLFLARSRRKKK